ncbi:nucleoside diphosphate kinase regulator [Zophobihabitans entericus]|uniref:Nucleoside diphosphate kinase regulator n=1 Tax=Zophobihabitans entericus TaxID=1635327 RepID=A0A6G9IAP2_9GAMM|nr:nucleoside diphosphate kinase regulator [Zophobihabitans entericus]QIQ20902.1 nucleoside diphosphate kinase regulator [Zophobihabitans entericus]
MSEFPSIMVSGLDYNRLMNLIDSVANQNLPSVETLEMELERAEVIDSDKMPANIITMNSTAVVTDSKGTERRLTLVYPRDANFDEGKISILAPVGVAILGLSVGQSINWALPNGESIKLKIQSIEFQPEAAGEFTL